MGLLDALAGALGINSEPYDYDAAADAAWAKIEPIIKESGRNGNGKNYGEDFYNTIYESLPVERWASPENPYDYWSNGNNSENRWRDYLKLENPNRSFSPTVRQTNGLADKDWLDVWNRRHDPDAQPEITDPYKAQNRLISDIVKDSKENYWEKDAVDPALKGLIPEGADADWSGFWFPRDENGWAKMLTPVPVRRYSDAITNDWWMDSVHHDKAVDRRIKEGQPLYSDSDLVKNMAYTNAVYNALSNAAKRANFLL